MQLQAVAPLGAAPLPWTARLSRGLGPSFGPRGAVGSPPAPPERLASGARPAALAAGACAAALACAATRRSRLRSAAVVSRTNLRAAAKSTKEKKPAKKMLRLTANQMVQTIFLDAQKWHFAPNCWYESQDKTTTGAAKVFDYWKVRPNREIERVADGQKASGCTWVQEDGRRGVTYVRLDGDGKVFYIREIIEPPSTLQFQDNNMTSLKPLFGFMSGLNNILNFNSDYLSTEGYDILKKRVDWVPIGIEQPKTGKASDVVRYLWDEVGRESDAAMQIRRYMEHVADDAVLEDLSYKRDVQRKSGKDAICEYQSETRRNYPEGLRMVLDEVSDGVQSCVAIWHGELYGQLSPRGVAFYSINNEGKVDFASMSYDFLF